MTKEEKGAIIEELAEKFAATPYFYITDASGLNVAKTNELRRLCFERGIEYRVVKNTLISKALERLDTDYSSFDGTVLKGFSGVMFHDESGKVAAKLIKDFLKANKNSITLKGASVDSALFIGHDQLDTLLNLKSKQIDWRSYRFVAITCQKCYFWLAKRWQQIGWYSQDFVRERSSLIRLQSVAFNGNMQ